MRTCDHDFDFDFKIRIFRRAFQEQIDVPYHGQRTRRVLRRMRLPGHAYDERQLCAQNEVSNLDTAGLAGLVTHCLHPSATSLQEHTVKLHPLGTAGPTYAACRTLPPTSTARSRSTPAAPDWTSIRGISTCEINISVEYMSSLVRKTTNSNMLFSVMTSL